MSLEELKTSLLTGSEPIPGLSSAKKVIAGTATTVNDFWSWAYSDILLNTTRGTFAEFLVASVLGLTSSPQVGWDHVDLHYKGKTIEIKASAYLQSWHQDKLSKITFGIGKRMPWDSMTNKFGQQAVRSADIYIFCLYAEKDKAKTDILDINKWEFYPVLTSILDDSFSDQKNLSFTSLKKVSTRVFIPQLKDKIDEILFV